MVQGKEESGARTLPFFQPWLEFSADTHTVYYFFSLYFLSLTPLSFSLLRSSPLSNNMKHENGGDESETKNQYNNRVTSKKKKKIGVGEEYVQV